MDPFAAVDAAGGAGEYAAGDAPSLRLPPLPGGVREEEVLGPWLLDPDCITFQTSKRGVQVPLGRGSHGVVYAGTYLGEDVAVKHVDGIKTRDDVLAWVQEVTLQYTAHVPGVLPVHGAFIDVDERTGDPLFYIVLERAAGSMEKLALEADAPLSRASLASRLRWLTQVASALRFLHARTYIHGDLKPGNVMMSSADEGTAVARVADFGSSLLRRVETVTHTIFRGVRGTYLYMDPVLFSGAGVTVASDVYSYGVMAWQVLTGRTPYVEEAGITTTVTQADIMSFIQRHVYVEGNRPPVAALEAVGVPAAVVDIIAACWAPAQAARPTMAVVESVLKEAMGDPARLPAVFAPHIAAAAAAAAASCPRRHTRPPAACTHPTACCHPATSR